jgi:arylsulfatase A-like enzyme
LSRTGGPPQTYSGEPCEIVTEAAVEFIRRQAAAKRPFLALVWLPSPHEPLEAGEKYREPYKDLPAKEQNYYGEIAAVDASVGKLRQSLRELGIAENTLLWFTSDNGPSSADPGSTGGLRGWKLQLWEGGIRVPGIIEWPSRIKQPMVTDIPCATSDIYPTIIDILGLKVPGQIEPLDGISLLPLIQGRMTGRPRPIGFWWNPRFNVIGSYLGAEALTGTWRTFRNHRYKGPRQPSDLHAASREQEHAALIDNHYKLHQLVDGHFELYNLMADPGETRDLAGEKPEVVKTMAAALKAWQLSVERSLLGQDYAAPGSIKR